MFCGFRSSPGVTWITDREDLILVNETMVRRYWNGDAIGSRFKIFRRSHLTPRGPRPITQIEPQAGEAVWFQPSFVHRRDAANQRSGVARKIHDCAEGVNREKHGRSSVLWLLHVVEDLPVPVCQPPLRVWYEAARIGHAVFDLPQPPLKVRHRRPTGFDWSAARSNSASRASMSSSTIAFMA
jgi:hypothetical protein